VQFEFGNYKDVAGVKMPFHIVLTWTDGQNTFELSDIQANVNIPATRFNQPAPYVAKAAAK
jgi:outer membrane lipoprotein-sorting protein